MKTYNDGLAPCKPNQSVALKLHGTARPLDEIARLLRGDVSGEWINISGPGHRLHDRSLGIIFDPTAPDGFRVNSFSPTDSPERCREYVKTLLSKLGEPGSVIVQIGDQVDRNADQKARVARGLV
jgi:hypothetical protein